jgi:hypothetical protein
MKTIIEKKRNILAIKYDEMYNKISNAENEYENNNNNNNNYSDLVEIKNKVNKVKIYFI